MTPAAHAVVPWLIVAAAILALIAAAWWTDTTRTPTGEPTPHPQTAPLETR